MQDKKRSIPHHIKGVNSLKLFDLMKNVPFTGITENLEISRVTSDSRQITPGCLFVCIAGARFDGHSAAEQVLKEGAAAVVCERDLGLDQQLLVEDSREAYGILCSNFYGNPAQRMKLIGITGTNGKTTCTYLIKHILESAGKKVGLIGTIHNEIGDMVLPAEKHNAGSRGAACAVHAHGPGRMRVCGNGNFIPCAGSKAAGRLPVCSWRIH